MSSASDFRGVHYRKIEGLVADSSRASERWFLGIQKGDTPENNPVSAITAEWIREWAAEKNIKLPTSKIVWDDGEVK